MKVFFFSSRRRHTRWPRDWSSDVCSSDLAYEGWKQEITEGLAAAHEEAPLDGFFYDIHGAMSVDGMEDAEGDLKIGRASCRERVEVSVDEEQKHEKGEKAGGEMNRTEDRG